jgi:recombinational DNA repair ATPase RecF
MRHVSAALAFVALTFVASLARAGTYLDTAALLLEESRRSADWVESHVLDQKLAAIAHMIAEERVKAGRRIEVPKQVDSAHPHLLLVLEATERAMAAAEDGDPQRFLRMIYQAREEERTYRAILQQMHLTLPELEHPHR